MQTNKYRNEIDVLADINQLVSSENYIEVIVEILFRDFMGSAEKIANSNSAEVISYNELAFLIGNWIKNYSIKEAPNDPKILIKKTDDVLLEYHNSMFFNNLDLNVKDISLYKKFENGSLFKEAFFYSSTAGYDRQYIDLLCKKYAHDKSWLKNNKGIDLDLLSVFFKMIKDRLDTRLHLLQMLKRRLNSKEKQDVFIFTLKDLAGTNKEYLSIIKALTIPLEAGQNKNYHDIADYNEFLNRPIIGLENERYFIPLPYFVAEALYESPFYWMNEDKDYAPIASNNRGMVAEDLVFQNVSKIFGNQFVNRNIKIKINKTKTLTDIDVIAWTKDTAIIFQVKAKKLTALSKKGELMAIKSDFTKAIVSANKQAETSIDALQNNNNYFFEMADGKEFCMPNVQRFLTLIVLLDQYPAISHQTHILLGEKMEKPPIAFSIFDLETLVNYLETGDRFADYIYKRTESSKYYRGANEMQYLGYYLRYGMNPLEKDEYVYIDPSFGQKMDAKEHETRIKDFKRSSISIGRNELCPCGSGKKFKRCHLT
ncbi:MAG: hypothetical protein EOO44_12185 [Flavobacterium sp.]|nr:MAG: hypothetical protein EOO44_12185 [Flavobacterium sp.]